jgi:hypothetical protein
LRAGSRVFPFHSLRCGGVRASLDRPPDGHPRAPPALGQSSRTSGQAVADFSNDIRPNVPCTRTISTVRGRGSQELQRLYNALRRAGFGQYRVQLHHFWAALVAMPRVASVFGILASTTTDFDVDAWVKDHVFGARRTCHEWPPEEAARLRVLHRIAESAAAEGGFDPTSVGRHLVYGDDLNDCAQAFTEHIIVPLMEYIEARTGTASEMLHHLERFRRQVEWFEQEALYSASVTEGGGEKVYDRRLREFLFASGVDFPFSQPVSASGRADVVADLEREDPLVCEIKLYDGDGRGVRHLRQGVAQAIRYARDYGQPVGHLVVFNLSDNHLQLPSDGGAPAEHPAHLHVEGVTVFIVAIQAKPVESASADRRRVQEFGREDLVPSAVDLEPETTPPQKANV